MNIVMTGANRGIGLGLHPGWVRTDMTQHTSLIDVETSVAGLGQVIARAGDDESGVLVAYDGSIVPW